MKEIDQHEKDNLTILRITTENAELREQIAKRDVQIKRMASDFYLLSLYRKYQLRDCDEITEAGEIKIKEEEQKDE